jgi:hypothetical protein
MPISRRYRRIAAMDAISASAKSWTDRYWVNYLLSVLTASNLAQGQTSILVSYSFEQQEQIVAFENRDKRQITSREEWADG